MWQGSLTNPLTLIKVWLSVWINHVSLNFFKFFIKAPPTARFITAATSQHSSAELWNWSSIYNPISLCSRVGLILKRHEVTSNKSHSHTAFRLLIWLLPCPRNWRSRPAAAWPSPCPCLASGTAQHRQTEQSKEKKRWLPLWHVYHHQRHYLGNINPASARGMSSHGVSRRWSFPERFCCSCYHQRDDLNYLVLYLAIIQFLWLWRMRHWPLRVTPAGNDIFESLLS